MALPFQRITENRDLELNRATLQPLIKRQSDGQTYEDEPEIDRMTAGKSAGSTACYPPRQPQFCPQRNILWKIRQLRLLFLLIGVLDDPIEVKFAATIDQIETFGIRIG